MQKQWFPQQCPHHPFPLLPYIFLTLVFTFTIKLCETFEYRAVIYVCCEAHGVRSESVNAPTVYLIIAAREAKRKVLVK
jgi:hypothetical protein